MKKRETMRDLLPPQRKRRKKPEISPEDRAIWHHVTKSIKPMPGREFPEAPLLPPEPEPVAPSITTPLLPVLTPNKPRILPLSGVEKRLKREVMRGHKPIDARIDLHGMRQAEAHRALLTFLYRVHHEGAKLVLVITGKGGGVDARGEERGVLRRLVPHWLADPSMRRLVIGFEAAGLNHGGEGALYVRIRKDRGSF